MTITVLPMDATAGAPAYSALRARQAQAPVYGNPTGRVFGGRSGWRIGTLPSIVSATSTTWTLQPCAAMIEPAASLYQGLYGWASDQVITGGVTAADANNPRTDILYIQVNDSSAGDGSGALSAPVSYLAGTAATTPAAPTLPPRSFLVATINVPKSGGGAPTATLNKQFFVAAGAPVPVFSQAERDGFTQYDGLEVVRLDKGGVKEMSVGGAWASSVGAPVAYTPALTSTGTAPSLGSGVALGQYQITGKSMTVQFFIPFSTTGNVGTGNYLVSLPTGFTYAGVGNAVPLGVFQAHISASGDISGYVRQNTTGGSTVYLYWQSAPTSVANVGANTVAWCAAAGNYIAGQITVPLA